MNENKEKKGKKEIKLAYPVDQHAQVVGFGAAAVVFSHDVESRLI